jgi:hypothetical protein
MNSSDSYQVFLDLHRYKKTTQRDLLVTGLNKFRNEFGSSFVQDLLRSVSKVINNGIDLYGKTYYNSNCVYPVNQPSKVAVLHALAQYIIENNDMLHSSNGQPILDEKINNMLYRHLQLIFDGSFVGNSNSEIPVTTAKTAFVQLGLHR